MVQPIASYAFDDISDDVVYEIEEQEEMNEYDYEASDGDFADMLRLQYYTLGSIWMLTGILTGCILGSEVLNIYGK